MITVEISINLKPIKTISAVNRGYVPDNGTLCTYDCYEGLSIPEDETKIRKILHWRDQGASVLAGKMIKEFPDA